MRFFHHAGYRFFALHDPERAKEQAELFAERWNLRGTWIIATEGTNWMLTSPDEVFVEALKALLCDWGCMETNGRTAACGELQEPMPVRGPLFQRRRILIKNEIVALGRATQTIPKATAKKLKATEFEEKLRNPLVRVVDCRNAFEVEMGSFPGAENPQTRSFKDFAVLVESGHFKPNEEIVMFCTGGIRCEKATAWMREQGFHNLSQLKGGVLSYLRETESAGRGRGAFEGECFVFDDRVSV
jgi:UPF0176 protein